jgi:hypothetical protein
MTTWHYREYFRKCEYSEFIPDLSYLNGYYYIDHQRYRVHDMPEYRLMASTKVYSEAWAILEKQFIDEYPSIEFNEMRDRQAFKFGDPGDEAAFLIKNIAGFETSRESK